MIALVDTFLVSTRRKVDTYEQGMRHHRWTIEQKQKIVLETFEPGASSLSLQIPPSPTWFSSNSSRNSSQHGRRSEEADMASFQTPVGR
jgi:hypothetical protein